MELIVPRIRGGRKAALAIGILTPLLTLVFLVGAVHATQSTSNFTNNGDAAGPDRESACTGGGGNEQSDCNTQGGSQTGSGTHSAPGLSGPTG